jgi:protein-tyrosine phosphatase
MKRAGEPDQTVRLQSARNFRDLGGSSTAHQRAVRWGQVYRSGSLSNLTDADVNVLERLGIRTVVDLRSEPQIEVFGPDRVPAAAHHIALPMRRGQHDASIFTAMRRGEFTSLPTLQTVNRSIIRDNLDQLGELIRTIGEEANRPLVFHCIGGKDRTGVASALLLSILGVPWATVQEDYLRSNEHLPGAVDLELTQLVAPAGRDPDEADLAALRRFLVVQPRDLDAARDEIIQLAGSIEGYVRDRLGIPDEMVSHLRDELLEG